MAMVITILTLAQEIVILRKINGYLLRFTRDYLHQSLNSYIIQALMWYFKSNGRFYRLKVDKVIYSLCALGKVSFIYSLTNFLSHSMFYWALSEQQALKYEQDHSIFLPLMCTLAEEKNICEITSALSKVNYKENYEQ